MKYTIEITEILSTLVTVDADSKNEAESKVREMYHNEDIILDESNYMCTEFSFLCDGTTPN